MDQIAEDARLIILRELARQSDGRLNDLVLGRVLDKMGVSRTREWLRTQLTRLEELEAVRVETIGPIVVVQLRQAGRDHVDRRALLAGVSRPADEA